MGTRSFFVPKRMPTRWAFVTHKVSCRRKRHPHRQGRNTMVTLNINGHNMSVDAANDTPLLWAIREQLQMTGTKFGCGAGLCGACTVHIEGNAIRSCSMPVSQASSKNVTTIEGLSANGLTPLQQAWIAEEVPQCGYCQVGQIMAAAALLAKTPQPTDDQITQAMAGNICRCGTYDRIRKAIHRAAGGAQ